jgi:putative two-component system response regulator
MPENPPILIVDDSEDVRILLKLKLNKLGYETIEAQDGDDALEVLEDNEDIKIVLMDIMMPNLSGFEVLELMAPFKEKRTIKVCFITADTREETIRKAQQVGVDGFITKPVTSDKLKEELLHIINEVYAA